PFLAESPVAVSLKHIQSTPQRPRSLNAALPQSIEDVILKAMAKDPNVRYQAAKDLAAAFWKALQQELFKTHALLEQSEGTGENLCQNTGSPEEDEDRYPGSATATQI